MRECHKTAHKLLILSSKMYIQKNLTSVLFSHLAARLVGRRHRSRCQNRCGLKKKWTQTWVLCYEWLSASRGQVTYMGTHLCLEEATFCLNLDSAWPRGARSSEQTHAPKSNTQTAPPPGISSAPCFFFIPTDIWV